MNTVYPMEFQRRVDRRWAERMNSASAKAHRSIAEARCAGQRRNSARDARDALEPLPNPDDAQGLQRRQ